MRGTRRQLALLPLTLALHSLSYSAHAVEKLVIDGGLGIWEEVRESSRFLSVSPDSLWIWPTYAGVNLAPDTQKRSGGS